MSNKTLDGFRPVANDPGRISTSHNMRKSCAVGAASLGVRMEVLREWLLVLVDSTVDTYAKQEANVEAGPIL